MTIESLEKEFKEVIAAGEKILKQLSSKILETVDVLKDDIIYGARLGQLKLKERSLERAKARVLYAIGRIVYKSYFKGEVKDANIIKLCEHLKKLEEISKKYHGTERRLKKRIISPI